MISFRRLLAVGSLLSLAAILTFTNVRGEPGRDAKEEKGLKAFRESGANPGVDRPDRSDRAFVEQLARSRFDEQPLVIYQTLAGETLFAAQVKPRLEAAAGQPRDVVLLIDTSASKAQGPLVNAIAIAKALAGKLKPEDRLALFVVNTRIHNITKGLKSPANLDDCWKKLAEEYPSGAANLKQAITDATATFKEEGRQRVLVLLGDGNSIANPINDNDRAALSEEMVSREVTFFSVPLGNHLEPLNLHGFANCTGGRVVRSEPRETVEAFVPRLLEALAVPVLYPTKVTLPGEVIEAFPTKLPPLRSDTPTLLVGKLKAGKPQFEYTITGRIAGKEVTVRTTEKIPEADAENFFLMGMVGQWKEKKDRPALMQANRALAFACDQNQMARLKLLTDAEFALDENKFDPALRLLHQVLDLDPKCAQAKFGIDLVQQMRDGKVTRKELIEKFRPRGDDVLVTARGRMLREEADPADPVRDVAPAPAPANRDVLGDVKARQAVADQQAVQAINDSLARANRLVKSQPDDALDLLKTTLDGIQRNPDVSERVRQAQSERIEKALAANAREGATVKRALAEGLAARAAADARIQREKIEKGGDDRVRVRMAEFHNLMNKAREDLAYQVTQDLREDLVNNGRPVPPAVSAGYQIGLSAYHLRELRELRRLRQDRWLAVMLSVERSHIPFSDEPGVEFPNTAKIKLITNYNSGRGFDNWRDWSVDRIKRYSTSDFGPGMPAAAYKLRDALQQTVDYPGFNDQKGTLDEVLKDLTKRYSTAVGVNLNFDINIKAFATDGLKDPVGFPIAEAAEIPRVQGTLGTVLKRILARVTCDSGATYIIRRETIEITTNKFQAAEKTLRVFPVADLVIPIPGPQQFQQQSFVNQGGFAGVGGSLGLAGIGGGIGALGGLGGGIGALGGLGGGIGALGGLGGGIGALGGLGGGIGALGGLGGGIGALGGLGGGIGALGGLGGGIGALGGLGGGVGALGGLGGAVGLGGGIGALGGLGGAAGIAGGLAGLAGLAGGQGQNGGGFGLNSNQSRQLIVLIRQVVGKPSDWAVNYNPYTGLPINPLDDTADKGPLQGEDNQLGFYEPANALIVKGSSHITARASSPVTVGTPAAGMGAIDGRHRDFARNQPELKTNLDPKVMWQDALAQGVEKPGMIIAVADFLALNKKFDHVVEFLKANLRQGIVVRPWVYESLAIALRETNASAEEIERAEVAAADLEPGDARSFLRAAEAMKANKNYTQAVAFARQASLLEPNAPYAYDSALVYAELAQDPKAMEWAAGNIVGKDWPAHDKDLKAKARQKLEALAKKLGETDLPTAEKMRQTVNDQKQRDLIVKLSWTGEADLDLIVKEPSGSTCSPLNRQTVGGGIFVGNPLEVEHDGQSQSHTESYLAAQGFTGTYQVTVKRVWGKPLGDKAQMTIIRHQGTPDQTEQIVTVDLKKPATPIQVKLEGGRRTETAYVPPPSRQDSSSMQTDVNSSQDSVMRQLRRLADPEMTGNVRQMSGTAYGMGAVASPSASRAGPISTEAAAGDRMLYQTRVNSFVKNSLDVTAQAVLAADCRSVRVSVTPVFDTNLPSTRPVVSNPIIPGGQ